MSNSRNTKKDRPPTFIRTVLAQNVEALRDQVFEKLRSPTARNKALASAARMRPSQIQRIIARDLGTSIDYVEYLAQALKVRPQDLLTPYFHLHPIPPPEPGKERTEPLNPLKDET